MTVATTMAATMSHPAQPLMDMFTPAWIKEELPTYTPKPRPENKEETEKVEEVEAAVAKLELTSKPARAMVMSPEAVTKHPLAHRWTLWYYRNLSKNWKENQRVVATVGTVEDFWAVLHHVEEASRLGQGCDYSLFKEGIFPDWEDPRNARGGRWMVPLDKSRRAELLDSYWLEVAMFLVGEGAGRHAAHLTGAVVNIRGKADKLGVWLGDDGAEDAVLAVGRMVKEVLAMDGDTTIQFHVHREESNRGGGGRKICV